ncbi:MAG: hypothetical protein GX861_01170 [Tenericutes bacterium]|nr:hypothetical protein [Mycoplasmatota bacterium]
MKLEFNSVEELYKRLFPALKSKVRELHRYKIDYIIEEDIWNYIKEIKWSKSKGLTLADMVSDILNLDYKALDNYIKNKFASSEKKINLEDINIL